MSAKVKKENMNREINIDLSIIIPIHNEEKKIEEDLKKIFRYFDSQIYNYEVICVNDGSKDNTLDVLKNINKTKKNIGNLKIISYSKNRGKGYAVKKGVLKATGKIVMFVDAGSCVPYEETKKGIKLLKEGNDVAIGSRGLEKSKIKLEQPFYRQVGSKLFSIIVKYFIGIKEIKDTQCGFKVFKREAAHNIFSKSKIHGFMFDIESIIRSKKLGLKIKEFPIEWYNDPDTRFNPVFGSLRNLIELWKIKFSR